MYTWFCSNLRNGNVCNNSKFVLVLGQSGPFVMKNKIGTSLSYECILCTQQSRDLWFGLPTELKYHRRYVLVKDIREIMEDRNSDVAYCTYYPENVFRITNTPQSLCDRDGYVDLNVFIVETDTQMKPLPFFGFEIKRHIQNGQNLFGFEINSTQVQNLKNCVKDSHLYCAPLVHSHEAPVEPLASEEWMNLQHKEDEEKDLVDLVEEKCIIVHSKTHKKKPKKRLFKKWKIVEI